MFTALPLTCDPSVSVPGKARRRRDSQLSQFWPTDSISRRGIETFRTRPVALLHHGGPNVQSLDCVNAAAETPKVGLREPHVPDSRTGRLQIW